jgi:serine O-acetyltransferase
MNTAEPPAAMLPARASYKPRDAGVYALMRDDCACVFARDPAARNWLDVLTIHPGVQAIAAHRIAHAWWNAQWKYAARVLAFLARWWTSIEIHPGAKIGRRFFIDDGCGVVIGETAVIGAGAKILGNIDIGAQARVDANSVVIADAPPGMTVVGNPGRIVKPQDMRTRRTHAIDLDHHEVPDPVGRALVRLSDRIEFLEARLNEMRHGTGASCTEQPGIEPGQTLQPLRAKTARRTAPQ